MTRHDLGQSLNLSERLVPDGNRNRPGHRLIPKEIAIHNTDNTDMGADTEAHSRLLIKHEGDYGNGPTSWHYTVDDKSVIKNLPLGEVGFHAYRSGNIVSIGIEICMNSDGVWESAVDRCARLVAILCFDFRWSLDAIKQHYDYPRSDGFQKNCPSRLRMNSGVGWENFITLVQHYLASLEASEGISITSNRTYLADSEDSQMNGIEGKYDLYEVDHGDIIIPEELLSAKIAE